MGPLGIGALLSGGQALLQGIVGGVQAAKGNKGFNKTMANRPDYEIPEEYESILAQYQQARAGNMPGYDQMRADINQSGARARGSAERGAISSTAYGAQVGDIYQKELDAIQNLGIQQEQYKSNMLDKVAGAQGQLAGQKSEQWNINEYTPWQTEKNRYGEMKKQGVENTFGAIQSGVGTMTDFLGTKYTTDAMKGLYGQDASAGSKSGMPTPSYSPQGNLNNTLQGLASKLKINFPK